MEMKRNFAKLTVLSVLAVAMAIPAIASAEGWDHRDSHRHWEHRRDERGTWGAIGLGSALVGIAGAVTDNRDLEIIGAAGTLYSGYRYETDHRRPIIVRERFDRYHHVDRRHW